MAALDYGAMAQELMSKGWAGSGLDPGRLQSEGWGYGIDRMPAQPAPGGDPFAAGGGKPPMAEDTPQTQPATLPGPALDPFMGLMSTIDRSAPVGPSTAPGVPVLPQEGGSMKELFGSVWEALAGGAKPAQGIAGTGVPAAGAPVSNIPSTNSFDAQLNRYAGGSPQLLRT